MRGVLVGSDDVVWWDQSTLQGDRVNEERLVTSIAHSIVRKLET